MQYTQIWFILSIMLKKSLVRECPKNFMYHKHIYVLSSVTVSDPVQLLNWCVLLDDSEIYNCPAESLVYLTIF